jgi:probable HAF family extracellular repeat protein
VQTQRGELPGEGDVTDRRPGKRVDARAMALLGAFLLSTSFPITGAAASNAVGPTTIATTGGTLTDLGTLGGSNSHAHGMSAAGQVVGDADTAGGATHAFIYTSGVMTDITPSAHIAAATAINDTGQVVGRTAQSGVPFHAFLYSAGTLTTLGTLGGPSSWATGINRAGQIVGWSETAAGISHAFLYSAGTMRDLGTLGGPTSQASGINDSGVVIGTSDTADGRQRGFRWSAGTMVDLGSLGGPRSAAAAINAAGQIVGTSDLAGAVDSGLSHGFLYSGGQMTDLGMLGTSSYPSAISASGQVVGTVPLMIKGRQDPFLWKAGVGMGDLSSFVPPSADFNLFATFAVTDPGAIAGWGWHNNNGQRAFVLTYSSMPTAGGSYHPVTPYRVLDTRSTSPVGGRSTLSPYGSAFVDIAGSRTAAGLPPDQQILSVAVNVTATDTTAASFLWVDTGDGPILPQSSLNWAAGQTVANLVQIGITFGGFVVHNAQGSVDVIVDLVGYVSMPDSSPGPDGLFNPVAPARILDTRPASQVGPTAVPVGPGGELSFQVAGAPGSAIPAGHVLGAVLTVTTTDATTSSYLTIWPDGASRPVASSLNWAAGRTVSNRVFVKLGSNGRARLYNAAGQLDVIVDVSGWFTDATSTAGGGRFVSTIQYRVLDTRPQSQVGPYANPVGPGGTLAPALTGSIGAGYVSPNAIAVALNVVSTDSTAESYLTTWPDGAARPATSDVNCRAGQTVATAVVTALGPGGRLDLFNAQGSADLVIDSLGWYQ